MALAYYILDSAVSVVRVHSDTEGISNCQLNIRRVTSCVDIQRAVAALPSTIHCRHKDIIGGLWFEVEAGMNTREGGVYHRHHGSTRTEHLVEYTTR